MSDDSRLAIKILATILLAPCMSLSLFYLRDSGALDMSNITMGIVGLILFVVAMACMVFLISDALSSHKRNKTLTSSTHPQKDTSNSSLKENIIPAIVFVLTALYIAKRIVGTGKQSGEKVKETKKNS